MEPQLIVELNPTLVREAASFLDSRIRRTPAEFSPGLSEELGQDVYLKLENLQTTGSFKIRGALFALHKLKQKGILQVATCSAGNHGKGVAYAAEKLGMMAKIYVPSGVDRVKYDAMVRMGADVVVSDFIGFDETEKWSIGEAEKEEIPFISAYDDVLVMAGNGGSVALEVLDQVPDAKTFVMPAGGGGHAAGFISTVRSRYADCKTNLVQHERSPAFLRSLEKGRAVTEMDPFETLASGLEGGFGRNTFEMLKDQVSHVALVSESDIRRAMKWIAENHQYIIEGSSAAAIAACQRHDLATTAGSIVVFISGRNISLNTFISAVSGL